MRNVSAKLAYKLGDTRTAPSWNTGQSAAIWIVLAALCYLEQTVSWHACNKNVFLREYYIGVFNSLSIKLFSISVHICSKLGTNLFRGLFSWASSQLQNREIVLMSKMTGSVQKYRDLCEIRAAVPAFARTKSVSPLKHGVTGIGTV
jgi:hypothetical protein